jgi:ATP-dependent protease ClpP protease subunit
MKPRQWYRFENQADDAAIAEIHIIDFIGDWFDDMMNRSYNESIGVTARAFVEALANLPDSVQTIRVHINSPGGDIQGGVNIANALREQQTSKGRTVETIVDGMAASIASAIAMAGSRVVMADNALLMVHNPWTLAIGDAGEMRKTADVLDAMRAQIVATYQWHSPLDAEALIALMDAETWMDADEAIANGFATEKVEGLKAAASIDPRAVAKLAVPEKFKARVEALLAKPTPAPAPPTAAAATDVLRLCREGECLDLAEGFITAKATVEDVTAQIATTKATKAQASARATEITALCATAHLPELATGYIAGAMPLDAIRAHLTTLTAKLDRIEIDGGLDPDHGTTPKARIDTAAIYAARNRTAKKE